MAKKEINNDILLANIIKGIEEVKGNDIDILDLRALENTMNYIYNNLDLQRKLSINSREMVTKKFNQNYVFDCILNEYNTILQPFQNDIKASY